MSIVGLHTVDTAGMRDAIDYLADQGVDGIVVVAPQRSAARAFDGVPRGMPRGMPAVVVEGRHVGEVSVVSVDQVDGARLATEHLIGLGHRTVWHVSGPSDWLEAESRIEGWRAALEAAGRTVPEPLTGDWSPRSGYAAGRRSPRWPTVTAVFVANDQMALGVLRALTEEGVKVPEQVSIVGFDDIPEAEFFPLRSPPSARTSEPWAGAASRCCSGRSETGQALSHERLIVPPLLVVRDSTAPFCDPR